MLANKKTEGHLQEVDKRLTEVMQQLTIAVGLTQYRIAAKTYELFDCEKVSQRERRPRRRHSRREEARDLGRSSRWVSSYF